MKKIIPILFLFLLFLSCYLIYTLNNDNTKKYLAVGDTVADNPYIKSNSKIKYDNHFVNKDYRIIDVLNIIKYNQELKVNDKTLSIHRLLKEADILIIGVGMNDIYIKLNNNTKYIYTYINEMTNNMELLLNEISRYYYDEVYILGYYNITDNNDDIFTYLNYKIKKLVSAKGYNYLDLSNVIKENYLEKKENYYLNNAGYYQINKLIVEKTKKSWYNIKRIYYYDLN